MQLVSLSDEIVRFQIVVNIQQLRCLCFGKSVCEHGKEFVKENMTDDLGNELKKEKSSAAIKLSRRREWAQWRSKLQLRQLHR